MSIRVTVADPTTPDAGGESWLLRVDDATTVAELAGSLRVPEGAVAPVDPATPLADAAVLTGARLPVVGNPGPGLPTGTLRLEVVGGPFAGESFALGSRQSLRVGTDAAADLRVADPALLPLHATVEVLSDTVAVDWDAVDAAPSVATAGVAVATGAGGAAGPAERRVDEVRPLGAPVPIRGLVTPAADAPVYVNGERVTEPTSIVPADLVQLGSTVLRLGRAPAGDADVSADSTGARAYNRPSRIAPAAPQPVLSLPGDAPDEHEGSPLPWLSAVLPVVLGVTMAFLFDRPVMLLMAVASPVMVVGSFLTNRRLARRKGQRTEAQWIADVKAAALRVRRLVLEQRLDGWYRLLDPVLVRDVATRPLSRLWERRIGDPDALLLRVGVAEVDLDVRIEGGSARERGRDRRVAVGPSPVGVDLREGVLGIAGPLDAVRSTARAAVTSLATLRSPRDLQVVVLCDDDAADAWSWVAWLPHAQLGDGVVALVGNTDDTRRERLREVTGVLDARVRASGERGGTFDAHVVVVVDGARRWRTLPGMVGLLQRGARYGVHVVALDADRSRLPEESAAVVVVDPADPATARVETGQRYHASVLLDGVSTRYADEVARSLCSVQHVSGAGDEALLPSSVRYVDLLGVDLDDPYALADRWATSPRQTYVVVGAGAEGETAIDIASDGPHALVAGTTGSGKSEFLQALVVSLALANRPDALHFVLIDYKGGSAFADCRHLPHTVGTVTNLDARETERALASLDAELKRRERVLGDMEAKDVDGAWAKDPDGASRGGLARLMIVIDEFAELKAELPDFITGLVRIARVGRSLGVHLVLATQRPSGVVTPEMQSNINLRIALRVTDRADSTDVLGSGEASLISTATPGRGYVRTGPGTAPTAFQTARVAGLRPGLQRTSRVLPPRAPIEWSTLGYPPRFPVTPASTARTDHDDTDLRALVGLVQAATQRTGLARGASPWLLPLPTHLPLDDLDLAELPAGAVALGLQDVPEEQTQRTLAWSVVEDSHLLFLGGSLSGRTTALRTVLAQAVQRFTPADLHLYVADYGNGALLPLADAPHCGAVVTPLVDERLPRLMVKLLDELTRRQDELSRAGVGSVVEQRRRAEDPAARLPFVVVAIDGWERLSATLDADRLVLFRDQVMRLLREGPAVGVRVVLTGDRSISGDKVSTFVDRQYVLPMRDVNDYRAAGIMVRGVPTDLPPGRVLYGPTGQEAQLATLGRAAGGEAQTAQLRAVVEQVRDAHDDRADQLPTGLPVPFRVDPLPGYVALSAARALPVDPGQQRPGVHPSALPVVGVGGDSLSAFVLDLDRSGGFVVAGGRGSGRSTALAGVLRQLHEAGGPALVVALRPSVLTETAQMLGVPVLADREAGADAVLAAVDGLAPGAVPTVVVDDAELLKQGQVEFGLTGVAGRVRFVVGLDVEAAPTLFGGPYAEAKKARTGILLGATSSVQGTQVLGTAVPRTLLRRTTPGGGVVLDGGTWRPVRVPDVRQ